MAGAKKQSEIPGTERETDPEIDAAAQDVYELTQQRIELQKKEAAARDVLLDRMKSKGIEHYAYIDGDERYDVKRSERESVSVRLKKHRDREEAAAE